MILPLILSQIICWPLWVFSSIQDPSTSGLNAKNVRIDVKHGENIAYVLELPFSSLRDEIDTRYSSLPFDIAKIADLKFDSNSNLKKIKEPVLILHAKDDSVRAILSCSNTQFFQDLFFRIFFLDQTASI